MLRQLYRISMFSKKHITVYVLAILLPAVLRAQTQSVIIPSGIYIVQSQGSFLTGSNFFMNGSYKQNAGVFTFGGSGNIRLDGSVPIAFNRVTVASGINATVNTAGQTINKVLLSNGTLNANGNLTLLSNASTTALVDGSGTGSVLGNLVVERYIDTAYGYRMISSPFQYDTVNAFSGRINLSASFPTFYRYDESDTTNGWEIYTAMGDTVKPGYGYAANFGSSTAADTMSVAGVVNNGSLSLTLHNHNNTYTLGYTLIGNPYPSPIDWNASSGWTKTNIDNAIYYFDNSDTDQYTGVYSSYVNGVSSDGVANNVIPAMQGFFVHVTNGTYPVTATLAMNNNVRVDNFSPFYHKPPKGDSRPLLRLNAKYSGEAAVHDATVIYFDESATLNFETEMDALKLMNTDKRAPNIYILTPDAQKLAISAMPTPSDSVTIIPVGIITGKDERVVFNASSLGGLPYGMHVYFADALSNTIQDLASKPQYQVVLASGEYKNRFSLIFSKKDITNTALTANGLNAYSSNGKFFVNLDINTGDKGELVIVNTLGQMVSKQQLTGYGYHEIPATFAPGVYILSFYSGNGVYSKKLPL